MLLWKPGVVDLTLIDVESGRNGTEVQDQEEGVVMGEGRGGAMLWWDVVAPPTVGMLASGGLFISQPHSPKSDWLLGTPGCGIQLCPFRIC